MKELGPHLRKRLKRYKKGDSPYVKDFHCKMSEENYIKLREFNIKRGNITELINIAISDLLLKLDKEQEVIDKALEEYYKNRGEIVE